MQEKVQKKLFVSKIVATELVALNILCSEENTGH